MIAGRFKDGDLLIAGEVEERLPLVTNGLIHHFPFDGNCHDRLTEYYIDKVITSTRDVHGPTFTDYYDYDGSTFLITGKIKCWKTPDDESLTSIGFHYMSVEPNPHRWVIAKTWRTGDINGQWVDFAIKFTLPSDFVHSLRAWFQIEDFGRWESYKIEFRDINYIMLDNPNVKATNCVFPLGQDFISIHEASKNYIENGNFSNGYKNWVVGTGDGQTFHEYIKTPYGNGIRCIRKDGNGGDWPISYEGPEITYNTGETWVWSFKFKVIKGNGIPFSIGWWFLDNGAWRCTLPIYTEDLEDGWKQAYAPYTFVEGPHRRFSGVFMNSQLSHTTVDFADIQLEKRNCPTARINGERGDAKLEITSRFDFYGDFTLVSEKKHILDNKFNKLILTKTGNEFKIYKNGLETTEYKNKWTRYTVKGVGIGRGGYEISEYTDPSFKDLDDDTPDFNMNISQYNAGIVWRTFVYCSEAVTVQHKYIADDWGAMRINNGPVVWVGGWNVPSNPVVDIPLVKGWNLVEMWYIDGGLAGAFGLVDGTPLTSAPQVLYMTAEIPIEFSANKIYFNEKSNCSVRDMHVYNRCLTLSEIQSLTGSMMPITSTGELRTKVKELPPYIPSDAVYFPLSINTKDTTGQFKAAIEENVVFEDGYAWVGGRTENLWATVGGHTDPWTVRGIIRKNTIRPYIGPTTWEFEKTGDSEQWHGWEGVYNGAFSGNIGDYITSSAYVKVINKAGINPYSFAILKTDWATWVSSSDKYNAHLIEDDIWHRISLTTKFFDSCDWGIAADALVWGYSPDKGLIYVSGVQWEKRPFITPFVDGIRERSLLAFNLHRDLGLNWNGDWSIVYFKIPVGTSDDKFGSFNLDSLGCGDNTVGGNYIWWGKTHQVNKISEASPTDIDPAKYYNNPRMISLVKSGSTLTIKEWSYTEGVYTRVISGYSMAPNGYVTKFGYDLNLGGWGWDSENSPTTPCNSFFRDLIVCKRGMTDTELDNLFKNRAKFTNRLVQPQNRIVEVSTLT